VKAEVKEVKKEVIIGVKVGALQETFLDIYKKKNKKLVEAILLLLLKELAMFFQVISFTCNPFLFSSKYIC